MRISQFTSLALTTLRTRSMRRRLMFWLTLLTMGMVTLSTILASPEQPLAFALSWLFCMILVTLLILLALYDMLSTPGEIRKEEGMDQPFQGERIDSSEDWTDGKDG